MLFQNVYEWMHCKKLKPQPDETEYVWIVSGYVHVTVIKPSLSIGEAKVEPSIGAGNLGIIFLTRLTLNSTTTCAV